MKRDSNKPRIFSVRNKQVIEKMKFGFPPGGTKEAAKRPLELTGSSQMFTAASGDPKFGGCNLEYIIYFVF